MNSRCGRQSPLRPPGMPRERGRVRQKILGIKERAFRLDPSAGSGGKPLSLHCRPIAGVTCPPPALPAHRLFHQAGDFPLFGMATELLFGEDPLSVHIHLEDSPAGGNQDHFPDLPAKLVEQLLRHTGGIGSVVSSHAELDAHPVFVHVLSPLEKALSFSSPLYAGFPPGEILFPRVNSISTWQGPSCSGRCPVPASPPSPSP